MFSDQFSCPTTQAVSAQVQHFQIAVFGKTDTQQLETLFSEADSTQVETDEGVVRCQKGLQFLATLLGQFVLVEQLVIADTQTDQVLTGLQGFKQAIEGRVAQTATRQIQLINSLKSNSPKAAQLW